MTLQFSQCTSYHISWCHVFWVQVMVLQCHTLHHLHLLLWLFYLWLYEWLNNFVLAEGDICNELSHPPSLSLTSETSHSLVPLLVNNPLAPRHFWVLKPLFLLNSESPVEPKSNILDVQLMVWKMHTLANPRIIPHTVGKVRWMNSLPNCVIASLTKHEVTNTMKQQSKLLWVCYMGECCW